MTWRVDDCLMKNPFTDFNVARRFQALAASFLRLGSGLET